MLFLIILLLHSSNEDTKHSALCSHASSVHMIRAFWALKLAACIWATWRQLWSNLFRRCERIAARHLSVADPEWTIIPKYWWCDTSAYHVISSTGIRAGLVFGSNCAMFDHVKTVSPRAMYSDRHVRFSTCMMYVTSVHEGIPTHICWRLLQQNLQRKW